MKRKLAGLVAFSLLLTLSGCSPVESFNPSATGASCEIKPEETTAPISVETTISSEQLDENAVMFFAQDRYDIEGDRYTIYRYNYKGELLTHLSGNTYIGIYAKNGLAPAVDPSSDKVGFVDRDGVFVLSPKYDDSTGFSPGGLATVVMRGDDYYTKSYGVINTVGEEIVPCEYSYISSFFPSGYAICIEPNADESSDSAEVYSIMNQSGNIVTKAKYSSIQYIYNDYFVADNCVYDFFENKVDELDAYFHNNDTGEYEHQGYVARANALYKFTIRSSGLSNVIKKEIFDGTTFKELETEYEISSKQVATTESGIGYGATVNGETVIPFKYDQLHCIGSYFVGTTYDSAQYTTKLDIYDSSYNKTASGLNYFVVDPWDERQWLPDGYFYIGKLDKEEDTLYGVIDETGAIIIEPIFSRGITYCAYDNIANYPYPF